VVDLDLVETDKIKNNSQFFIALVLFNAVNMEKDGIVDLLSKCRICENDVTKIFLRNKLNTLVELGLVALRLHVGFDRHELNEAFDIYDQKDFGLLLIGFELGVQTKVGRWRDSSHEHALLVIVQVQNELQN
jgi:hypothetical protein